MKANILIASASGLALTLACSAAPAPPAPAAPPAPQTAPQTAGPQPRVVEWDQQDVTNFAESRDLLFLDETLEEFTSPTRRHQLPPFGQWESFASAGKAVRAGRVAEAKKHLHAGMEHPETGVRERIWAWNALRGLGENPPPNVAREVRAVVLEVPVEEWLDVLAVYADGRVTYLNGKRGAIHWEDTRPSDINALAAEVLKAAAPLAEKSRPVRKHSPPSMSAVRVTVLTYAGMYAAEGDPLNPPDDLAPTFNAGMRLFLTLLKKLEE